MVGNNTEVMRPTNPRLFGTAGIRGIFNASQFPAEVYKVCEATALTFGKGRYGVGWDGRKTSALLAKVVCSAISSAGSDIVTFGLVPTPVLAFNTREDGCLVGFSVTASHNPPEFSGVKFFEGDGMELDEEDEKRIERAFVVESSKSSINQGMVSENNEAVDRYATGILNRFSQVKTGLKLVVDCANGPGALVTPYVLKQLGHLVIPLNAQVSWSFPAHDPEPLEEQIKGTCRVVSALRADLGLVHDGDADRLVLVNALGEVVSDSLLTILALESIQESGGSVVISENTSSAVSERALSRGLRVVRSRVGKTFAKMRSEAALMGSEPSKIVHPSWGMWEDGIYTAVIVADILSKRRDLLKTTIDGLDWNYKRVNIRAKVEFSRLVEKVNEVFRNYGIEEKRDLDGLKLVLKDESWIMFRQSGTENLVRIYCESRDPGRLDLLLQEGIKCVRFVMNAER
jgi:phosphomannomutase